MICNNCGTELERGTAVCPVCGGSCPVCTQCGEALTPGLDFCVHCGASTKKPVICSQCGSEVDADVLFCTHCGAAIVPAEPEEPLQSAKPIAHVTGPAVVEEPVHKQKKKGPGKGARVVLRLLSGLLGLCLFASMVATTLVLDVRQLTNGDKISQVVSDALSQAPAPVRRLPTVAMAGIDISIPNVDTENMGSIVDFIYDAAKDKLGDDLKVTPQQMKEFYEQSSAKEFVTEKVGSYVKDLVTGKDLTSITPEDLMGLIDDNVAVIESVFGVKVDDAFREKIMGIIQQLDLEGLIRDQIIGKLAQMSFSVFGTEMSLEQLLATLEHYSDDTILWIVIAIDVLLVVLMFFTNWLRFGATLRCAATPVITVGAIFAVPTFLLQLLPGTADNFLLDIAIGLIDAVVALLAPVHYTVLLVGVALLVLGFIVKVIAKTAAE